MYHVIAIVIPVTAILLAVVCIVVSVKNVRRMREIHNLNRRRWIQNAEWSVMTYRNLLAVEEVLFGHRGGSDDRREQILAALGEAEQYLAELRGTTEHAQTNLSPEGEQC